MNASHELGLPTREVVNHGAWAEVEEMTVCALAFSHCCQEPARIHESHRISMAYVYLTALAGAVVPLRSLRGCVYHMFLFSRLLWKDGFKVVPSPTKVCHARYALFGRTTRGMGAELGSFWLP